MNLDQQEAFILPNTKTEFSKEKGRTSLSRNIHCNYNSQYGNTPVSLREPNT